MTYKNNKTQILYSINVPLLIVAVAFSAAVVKTNYDKKVRAVEAQQVAGEQAVQDGIYKQTITQDGKTAEITKEVRDGKVYINIKTYDSNGNLLNSKDTVKDLKTPTKTQTQPTVKKTETQPPVQKPIEIQPEVPVETTEPIVTPTPGQIQNTNRFQIVGESYTTNSNFPLTVNEETGNIVVETPLKLVELTTTPEAIAQKAVQARTMARVNSVKIESSDNENVNVVLNGSREISILGLVNFELPATAVFNAETGALKNSSLDVVSRITGVFSN